MDNNKLTLFLYVLGRDYLPLGSIEAIMKNHVEKSVLLEVDYSNKYLEKYARSVSDRLTDE